MTEPPEPPRVRREDWQPKPSTLDRFIAEKLGHPQPGAQPPKKRNPNKTCLLPPDPPDAVD